MSISSSFSIPAKLRCRCRFPFGAPHLTNIEEGNDPHERFEVYAYARVITPVKVVKNEPRYGWFALIFPGLVPQPPVNPDDQPQSRSFNQSSSSSFAPPTSWFRIATEAPQLSQSRYLTCQLSEAAQRVVALQRGKLDDEACPPAP